jgi:hypothetical protein
MGNQATIIDQAELLSEVFGGAGQRRNVGVVGQIGAGKTTLCAAIARQFIGLNRRVVITTHSHLATEWADLVGVEQWSIDPTSYVDCLGDFLFVNDRNEFVSLSSRTDADPLLIVVPFDHRGWRRRNLNKQLSRYIDGGLLVNDCPCCGVDASDPSGSVTQVMTGCYASDFLNYQWNQHWFVLGSGSSADETFGDVVSNLGLSESSFLRLPRWTAAYIQCGLKAVRFIAMNDDQT